jgi:hypothetical protein
MKTLPGTSAPVAVAPGYQITAPGLKGTVKKLLPNKQGYRSGGVRNAEFEKAAKQADLRTIAVLEMNVRQQVTPRRRGVRSSDVARMVTREAEPAFALAVPDLGKNVGYAALYTDEAGTSRWFLPAKRKTAVKRTRGAHSSVVFYLPRPPAHRPAKPRKKRTRGMFAKMGRRVVRVVTWATDPIVGVGLRFVAKKWEDSKRPYGFVQVAVKGFSGKPDWKKLEKGRALLLLHGTFSTAASAFDGLRKWKGFPGLLKYYGNRAFAFDHPTLHVSPSENMERLCQMLPKGISLDCDIITHSRGGLVGRELIERITGKQLGGRKLSIRRAVFVAGPLDGTVLADGQHMFDFMDRYTNLLTWLPDTVSTLTLEALLAAVRLLAHGGLPGLPGLHSMLPKGPYLSSLNPGTVRETRYHAIAADFKPKDKNLLARFAKSIGNGVLEKIFDQENDGVVPTRGAYKLATAGGGFPVPKNQRLVLGPDAQVNHLNFFSKNEVNRKIADWLMSN